MLYHSLYPGGFSLSRLLIFLFVVNFSATNLTTFSAEAAEPLPAFIGAKGFGSTTVAGSGRHLSTPSTKVIRVTNLNDTGSGSLRECAQNSTGPRVCIFEISGVIVQGSTMIISNPYLTIAGATAPNPGIMLRGCGVQIETHDVLIKHIESRPGDGIEPLTGACASSFRNAWELIAQHQDVYNVVLDHVTGTWSLDEGISSYVANGHRLYDITVSNSLIAEGLWHSIHDYPISDAHSTGALWGKGSNNITLYRNLFAHNQDRNVITRNDSKIEMINSVYYNWGGSGPSNTLNSSDRTGGNPGLLNLLGNYYKRGPNSPTSSGTGYLLYSGTGDYLNPLNRYYLSSNIGPLRPNNTGDDWLLVHPNIPANRHRANSATFPGSGIIADPPIAALTYVTLNVGSRPAFREANDQRIINDVINGTGRIIDCVSATRTDNGLPCPLNAGGWILKSVNRRTLSPPGNNIQPSGYTALEEWLQGFDEAVERTGSLQTTTTTTTTTTSLTTSTTTTTSSSSTSSTTTVTSTTFLTTSSTSTSTTTTSSTTISSSSTTTSQTTTTRTTTSSTSTSSTSSTSTSSTTSPSSSTTSSTTTTHLATTTSSTTTTLPLIPPIPSPNPTLPAPSPTPVTPDPQPVDSDGDGLSDEEEIALGTDPYLTDSDYDGISDRQEMSDLTNPLDPGSGEPVLQTTVCTEWNGFLGGMWNILELANRSLHNLFAQIILYSQSGIPLYSGSLSISAGTEQDALIHQLPGWTINSYGKVCIRHNGVSGDLDGRMAFYKQGEKSEKQFQFGLVMPFSNGKLGSQFVGFNTYQPSMVAEEQNHLVANWIQLSNQGNSPGHGTLILRDLDGLPLANWNVNLAAAERLDISAHQFGSFKAGAIEWRPQNNLIPYTLRNVRYLYDNPGNIDSFATAFQISGSFGSGEELLVPVSTENETSVLEISNTLAKSVLIEILLRNNSEETLPKIERNLPPYATQHIILDTILGPSKLGMARIRGNARASISAVAMQYGRKLNRGIRYIYGMQAKEAFGTVLNGTYNTNLGQHSILWLMNGSQDPQTVTLSLKRYDGTVIVQGELIEVGGNSFRVIDLNQYESPNQYGVVVIQSFQNKSIVAWVNRVSKDFVIPTFLTQ